MALNSSRSKQEPTRLLGLASFLVEFQLLPIWNWQTNHMTCYHLRNTSTFQVLTQPKWTSWQSSSLLGMLLEKKPWFRIRFKPDCDKDCNADFLGNWNKLLALHDPSTVKSHSGWIVFYYLGIKIADPGCTFYHWSQIYLYVPVPTRCSPIMVLIQEIRGKRFPVIYTKHYVYCKVFKDNSGALELARLPKLRPHTKHINICYHHFCKHHMWNNLIKIFPIRTKDQIANALTKALPQNDFQQRPCHMCGL